MRRGKQGGRRSLREGQRAEHSPVTNATLVGARFGYLFKLLQHPRCGRLQL